MDARDARALLERINRQHQTDFQLAGRFSGGEQGAFQIVDEHGTRFVLKWHHNPGYVDQFRNARIVTDELARRGYPVPRYQAIDIVDGTAYTIQSVLQGRPMGALDAGLLPELLRLNDLQARSSPLTSHAWPHMVIHSVLHGFEEYCVIETLRRYSSTTSELLDRLQSLVTSLAHIEVATSDVVHFDFTPANVLVLDSEISGVIDWDGTTSGDRAFDLATLFFYASDQPAIRELLWRSGVERSSPDAMRLYLSHMIVRQLDWVIRYHGHHVIEHWLDVSRGLIDGGLKGNKRQV